MLATLPSEFNNIYNFRDEHVRVRVTTKVWTEILLSDLDRPLIHGRIRQLVGKKIGPGVYEITLQPLDEEVLS